jgi:hypothetical protein
MALAILDGTQTATTLSTILSSGQHITAHTVVSLGTQAITDMRSAVSGSVVSVSSLPAISGTVTAQLNYVSGSAVGLDGGSSDLAGLRLGYNSNVSNEFVIVNENAGLPISGTVTANLGTSSRDEVYQGILSYALNEGGDGSAPLNINVGNLPSLPAGTNRIGVVTIGGGTVTIGAGTAQIGSVTASISSFATSVTARLINPAGTAVTYAEVGTAGSPSIDVLSVQGVTAGTPINVYPAQGTTVSNTNFTSTTASTSLVSAVTGREVLTVFNEGAGNLHISPGATATTISYQVRLSAGDYWECPEGQLSLAHSAVFATAGTARICQVS